MKCFYSLLVLIFISSYSFSQDTFSVFYPNPFYAQGGAEGSSVHVQEDTIYVVIPSIVDVDLRSIGYILKYDFQGNLLDSIRFDSQNPDLDVNLGRYGGNILEDDHFILPMLEFNNSNPTFEGYSLLKTTTNGTVIWKKNITTDPMRRHHYRKVIPFHNGYAIVGDITDSLINNSIYDIKGIVTITDHDGNILWHKEYDDSYGLFYAQETDDGGLVLGSSIRLGAGSNHVDMQMIRTDSIGNEQWRHTYGEDDTEGTVPVIQAKDGSFISFGYDHGLANYGFARGPFWIKRLIDSSIPPYYEVVDSFRYDVSNAPRIIRNVLELPDSSIIVVGRNGYFYDFDNYLLDYAFIGKLDANLDSLWTHYYTLSPIIDGLSREVFHDVKLMPDNGFIATGVIFRSPIDPDFPIVNQMILLRLDEFGCLEPGCQYTGIQEIIIGLENTMVLYPNPIRSGEPLNLQFSEHVGYAMPYAKDETQIIIYDMMGREVYRQSLAPTGSNDSFEVVVVVPSLSNGQYTLQWVGEAWYDAVQFVVE